VIPYSRQSINNSDINSVIRVLKSNYLTQGPNVEKFENEIKKICQVKFSSSVNSATSALHLSCLALGLKKNDYLWTSPISFVASSNCALYCGAKVDFVDINIQNFNLDINILKQKLIEAKKEKKLPKILVAVHMAGVSCEMSEIKKLSIKYNFKIIEDASHCTGSRYKNLPVGSCKYSDITVFSFHPVKIITTGEGGMILTNNNVLDSKIKILRSSGINKNLSRKKLITKGLWFYEQQMLGYNYRMSDIAAALGLSQSKKINIFIKKRNIIAKRYVKLLKNYPVKFQFINKNSLSSFHLFIIRVNKSLRKELFNKMRKNGYYVNIHYIPIHLQPYYKRLGFKKGMYPLAEKYYNETLSIPIYPDLTKKNQLKIINLIKKTLKN
tara:strand:+ start:1795 stop:2943 length:1149 start_codon:yes stop_codon:yes gene_type:complete